MNPFNPLPNASSSAGEEEQQKKNFIRFSPSLKAKVLAQMQEAMEYIENTPAAGARAFPISEDKPTRPGLQDVPSFGPTGLSLEEQTAGVCVIAFGPLAILLMSQINAMNELYNQIEVMSLRAQKHQQQQTQVKPSSLIV